MHPRRRLPAMAAALVCVTALLAGCETEDPTPAAAEVAAASPIGIAHAGTDDPAVATSRFLFDSASAVVLVPQDGPEAPLERARDLGVPALPDTEAGRAEAERLGARILGPDDEIRAAEAVQRVTPASVAVTTEPTPIVETLADVGGAAIVRIAADPRTDVASIKVLREHVGQPLLSIGAQPYQVEVVHAGAETTAGGYLALPGHHYLAMYGHPETSALGVLGEQNPKKSVARVRRLVRKYERSDPKASFAPAFEIIATVASAAKGPRGDYSRRTPIRTLRPLVDAAKAAGVTVILDLQPGRSDLLSQAKAYESLLRQPHVGLAVDPEWKLGKKGKPLQRIGHVSAAEINRTSEWLADLTRRHTLPQKLFVVHQFQTQMVRHRERLVTTRPELATIIHVDGQGPPAAKIGTWNMIRKDAPKNVHWGWKNFLDEDEPMLDTAQTWRQVRPHPALITYQ